jgi:hypothetical protein
MMKVKNATGERQDWAGVRMSGASVANLLPTNSILICENQGSKGSMLDVIKRSGGAYSPGRLR